MARPERPTDLPMNLGRSGLNFTMAVSATVLGGLRSALMASSEWSTEQIKLTPGPVASWFNSTIRAMEQAATGLSRALAATTEAVEKAQRSIDTAEEVIRKALFENIAVSSIAGQSFGGITISEIHPSFRRNGKDVATEEALKGSEQKQILLCVPGLFCDESMWMHLHPLFEEMGYHVLYVRWNPGSHISDNGRALQAMIKEVIESIRGKVQHRKLQVITFSQGGLILRSALYQMRERDPDLKAFLGRVLFISSPDGGSYIEKIGYWVNATADAIPLFPASVVGWIGRERSDAMKDLSHGIIREEDWLDHHVDRYRRHYYFGELEGIDAFQVYSLVTSDEKHPASLLGDGVVERSSLERLSEIYKNDPQLKGVQRIYRFTGLSHYSIIGSDNLKSLIDLLFRPMTLHEQ